MPNLLSTPRGRLLAFFLLYVSEGIPFGFASKAVVYQMRSLGLSPAAVGAFVATLYLPWAWKWVAGPFVDAFYSPRLGRRRAWIFGCQVMMAVTLLLAMPIDFVTRVRLFSWIVIVHNIAAAIQDVAIDALACESLLPDERGRGSGLMFAGQYLGAAIGGAGVLFLAPYVGFNMTFFFVIGAILAITAGVTVWLKERPPVAPAEAAAAAAEFGPAGKLAGFIVEALKSFVSSRGAFLAVFLALLPMGSMAMTQLVNSSLIPEMGFTQHQTAWLALIGAVPSALGCIVGGSVSDFLGRRRAIAIFVFATMVPTLAFAYFLQRNGWVMPGPTRAAPRELVVAFWAASLSASFVIGLIYGSRTALYMDVSNPAVAATQFTAYMSLMNLTLAYTSWWQGHAAQRFGYPKTLALDAALGCVCMLLVPFIVKRPAADEAPEAGFPVIVGAKEEVA